MITSLAHRRFAFTGIAAMDHLAGEKTARENNLM
jgi:hypothetical protein